MTATFGATVAVSETVELCEGQTFTLPDGQVLSEAAAAASYLAPAIDGGCDTVVTVVAQFAAPARVQHDTLHAVRGDSLVLDLGLPAAASIAWSGPGLSCTDCPAPSILVDGDAVYTYDVDGGAGCTQRGVVTVLVPFVAVATGPAVFIPSAFSPNGDGVNDRLVVFGDADAWSIARFEVYGRWGGQLIKRGNLSLNRSVWTGHIGGEQMPEGVYTVLVVAQHLDGRTEVATAAVHLIR